MQMSNIENQNNTVCEATAMTKKRLVIVSGGVALSIIFPCIFYIVWMVVAIPITKSDFGGLVVQALM